MIPLKQYLWMAKITKLGLKLRLSVYFCLLVLVVLVFTNPFLATVFISSEGKHHLINQTTELPPPAEKIKGVDVTREALVVTKILPNCGIRYQCPPKTFPVHVYTGRNKDDEPALCVSGRYFKGIGRGINVAVVESKFRTLAKQANFDIYTSSSERLEEWLEKELEPNDMFIAFTFDEASKELRQKAKEIFYDLGSGKIQDLHFRSQWYMISQKGLKGFTPLENITYAKNNFWGEVINETMCVPYNLQPLATSPNPAPRQNPDREKFCKECEELQCDDFCHPLAAHEPLMPSLLTNRSLIGNAIFSTPVLVIAGESLPSLILTLQSLLYQPGIQPKSVTVLSTTEQVNVPSLSRLFQFNSFTVNASLSFGEKVEAGILRIIEIFKKDYVIVLEPSLILSPDFLFYFGQMIPIVEKDTSILGVTAWNPYGYVTSSGNVHLAFRTENFPGLGFLIPISTFTTYMKGKMDTCCNSTTYDGWILPETKGKHMIAPDISRVMKRPKDIYDHNSSDYELQLFTGPRITNTDEAAHIDRPYDLSEVRYFQKVANLIQSSTTFHLTKDDLNLCQNGSNIALNTLLHELRNRVVSIYVKEKTPEDTEVMRQYMKCFGIFIPPFARIQNLYMKTLRLTVNTNTVFLIDFTSPFAKNKINTYASS